MATFTTKANGLWLAQSSTVWGASAPGSGDTVVINHQVGIDGDVAVAGIGDGTGELYFTAGRNNLTVNGTSIYGTPGYVEEPTPGTFNPVGAS